MKLLEKIGMEKFKHTLSSSLLKIEKSGINLADLFFKNSKAFQRKMGEDK